MKVKELVNRIRLKITDGDAYRWSDDDIVQVINAAMRFMRNIFIDEVPEMLAEEPIKGTLLPGENVIELPFLPIKILDVRCNGRIIHASSLRRVEDTSRTGIPKVYTLGLKKLNFYPIPQHDVTFSVTMLKPYEELTEEDDIPYTDDFEDDLLEYAALRLSLIDEFDESVEMQITTQIHNNVATKLQKITPEPCVVDSYY